MQLDKKTLEITKDVLNNKTKRNKLLHDFGFEVKEYTEKVFEDIKHIDENNHEYWLARDLMPLLEYSKWENFNNVIQKAITSYKNSNNDDTYWLPEVRKPIITGKGKEEFIKDYKLSRYICYLIV